MYVYTILSQESADRLSDNCYNSPLFLLAESSKSRFTIRRYSYVKFSISPRAYTRAPSFVHRFDGLGYFTLTLSVTVPPTDHFTKHQS